jgi:hypothetical protein
MPLAAILMAIDIALVIHAAKTGRFSPWGFIILLIPGIGALAYVLVELLPEWLGSAQGQGARKRLVNTLDPERRYRELSDLLAIADTVANRETLAVQCLALGKFEEAKRHFDEIVKRPLGEEPIYYLGLARAQFGLGRPSETIVTLDDLKTRWPSYQSNEGHLLYARALEESGRDDEAIEEYKVLADCYPGAEARVRYGLLLDRLGRRTEAKAVLSDVLTYMKRAPKYVRKVQAEWIAAAEKALRI